MTYFQTFANCLIVKGANRSLICDLQRQESDFIPNDIADILEQLNAQATIKSVLDHYGQDNKETIEEYLQYFDEKEYGFFCEQADFNLFPPLNTAFQVPALITNAVLEMSCDKIACLETLISQLTSLGCSNIAMVFFEELQEEDFFSILQYFKDSGIKSVEITCRFHRKMNRQFFLNINAKISPLTRLVLFSARKEQVHFWDEKILFDIFFTTANISSFNSCGIVDRKYFNTNLPKVLEAINHNSCLHKKISIDKNGDIKNCPAMPESFGNISDTRLEAALQQSRFKQYWNITKDQITVCKDCEFRYICTDCRAFKDDPENDYSRPLKCGYDPYTNEWEDWSTHPLKQKAIAFYKLKP